MSLSTLKTRLAPVAATVVAVAWVALVSDLYARLNRGAGFREGVRASGGHR
jgi:hypothetical protein